MSLNLIGRASGVCHFLAISGFALAWGRVGRGPPGLGSLEAQDSACSGGGAECVLEEVKVQRGTTRVKLGVECYKKGGVLN